MEVNNEDLEDLYLEWSASTDLFPTYRSQVAEKLIPLLFERNKQYKRACESAAETLNFLRE